MEDRYVDVIFEIMIVFCNIAHELEEHQSISKQQIKADRLNKNKQTLDKLRGKMYETKKRQNDANQESGSYNWLITLPIKEHGYDLGCI